MINKPAYKLARRLGTGLFEKTQTQKFALRDARRKESGKRPRPKTDFGMQLLEKQKARFLYGINERQFKKYVTEALRRHGANDELLYESLEARLDNMVYRLHLAPTRRAARQLVSHGHMLVNGVRITTPSYRCKAGDIFMIREASASKRLFADLAEREKGESIPAWVTFDVGKRTGEVVGKPKLVKSELLFDVAAILEFYRR